MTSENIPEHLYIPQPFADGANNHETVGATQGANINFVDGFPDAYSASNPSGGKFVTRKEINALGYIATANDYQKACGGVVTFDPALATKIGGYPKGAILEWVKDLEYYRVISLVDNNKVDFRGETDTTTYTQITNGEIDGANWAYATAKSGNVNEAVVLADVDLGEVDAETTFQTLSMNAASFVTPREGAVSVALTLGEILNESVVVGAYTYNATMYYKVPGAASSTSLVLIGNDITGSSRAAEAVKLPRGTLCSIILAFGNIHFKSVKLKATIV